MFNRLCNSKRVFICLVAAATQVLYSDIYPLITNVLSRDTHSLNGKWNYIIDPYETGFYDYRYQESGSGYFRNQKPRDKSDLVEYDFDKSPLINVPGDWNSQRSELLFYEGTIWYKKSFDDPRKDPSSRLFVYFGAANYEAIVYLNGKKLGKHIGGFTPFCFEITDGLRPTQNDIVVKVDNKRYREAIPTVNTDWWNYGGLTRDVCLIETPQTFIRDYSIQLKKDSRDTIAGWIQLDGIEKEMDVTLEIEELGIKRIVTPNSSGKAEFEFAGSPVLWSPASPKLYDVTLTAGDSTVRDQIGFRTIQVRGQNILLNGQSVFLRGICIHEESPLGAGRACTPEDAEVLLGWAQELGCNFVRLAHYPHNEYMLRTADRMGILVWSELPVYWTILWDNQATLDNALNQLEEMITRDKNRASVILWSVANETPVSEPRLTFLRALIDRARQMDATRLITAAMEKTSRGNTVLIEDPLGKYLDVLGCNEYIGWYEGTPELCDKKTWQTSYEKPLIMSEFGGGALQGYHADDKTRFSEEYLERLYIHQVAMLKKIPFLRGTTPWLLKDFRSPRRPLPDIQDYYNRKGLFSETGQRKKAFYIMQDFYQQKAKEANP
ncbi:MAG: beta galactosidase jelly roll domain-containing protein [Sedimentisphaerales bacterium]|nr:beta galactosidase jelly roll domain-containing protein [Sedimentisphaerales bacterium]